MGYATRDRIHNDSIAFAVLSFLTYWFIVAAVVVFNIAAFRIVIRGRERLQSLRGRGCFLISNHTLYFDPAVVVHAIAPRRTVFTALQSTFSMPVVGNLIRLLGALPIPSDMGLTKLRRHIRAALEHGRFVHFFPEGELTHRSGTVGELRLGVFVLAHSLGVPVVPVTIAVVPAPGGRRLRPFRVQVSIGRPIYPREGYVPGRRSRRLVRAMADEARSAMAAALAEAGVVA